jgi:hypothetical protein
MALCVRYLHRHPLELAHLPAEAIADLIALAWAESEALEQAEPL